MKAKRGGKIQLRSSLTSTLDTGQWSASRPGHFNPQEEAQVPYEENVIFVPSAIRNIGVDSSLGGGAASGIEACLLSVGSQSLYRLLAARAVRCVCVLAPGGHLSDTEQHGCTVCGHLSDTEQHGCTVCGHLSDTEHHGCTLSILQVSSQRTADVWYFRM